MAFEVLVAQDSKNALLWTKLTQKDLTMTETQSGPSGKLVETLFNNEIIQAMEELLLARGFPMMEGMIKMVTAQTVMEGTIKKNSPEQHVLKDLIPKIKKLMKLNLLKKSFKALFIGLESVSGFLEEMTTDETLLLSSIGTNFIEDIFKFTSI